VASEGTCEPRSQPRMRRRDLSTSRRSIRALGVGTPTTALATKDRGEGATVLGRPARPPRRLGNEGFEADHVEGGDETAQRFGDRIVVPAHLREQKAQRAFIAVERVVCHVYS
jgi:hypothetical protein